MGPSQPDSQGLSLVRGRCTALDGVSVSPARKGRRGGRREEHFPSSKQGRKTEQHPSSPESGQSEEGRKGAYGGCGVPRCPGCRPAREDRGAPGGPSLPCPPEFRGLTLFHLGLCLSWGQELVGESVKRVGASPWKVQVWGCHCPPFPMNLRSKTPMCKLPSSHLEPCSSACP